MMSNVIKYYIIQMLLFAITVINSAKKLLFNNQEVNN